MIRYRYNRQLEPPAPFVHVSLRCPETGIAPEKIVAVAPAYEPFVLLG
jgi:hypothetical protein